jgi:hypothetical protein
LHVLVCCTKKNLATLQTHQSSLHQSLQQKQKAQPFDWYLPMMPIEWLWPFAHPIEAVWHFAHLAFLHFVVWKIMKKTLMAMEFNSR